MSSERLWKTNCVFRIDPRVRALHTHVARVARGVLSDFSPASAYITSAGSVLGSARHRNSPGKRALREKRPRAALAEEGRAKEKAGAPNIYESRERDKFVRGIASANFYGELISL